MKDYFEDLYIEQYLMSEFTFGFEFEGYLDEDYYKDDIYDLWYDYSSKIASQVSGSPEVKDDGSLNDYHDGEPFELASQVIKFNPLTIGTVIQFLGSAIRFVSTDDTCGFHIHIGFPEKNKKFLGPMMLWVLLNLIANNGEKDMFKEILHYKGYQLFTDEYAVINFLINAKMSLERAFYQNEDFNKSDIYFRIKEIYDDEKFRILRMHPQGTLEWRGPRGFLDSGQISIIRGFFNTKLFPFVKWIADSLSKDYVIIHGIKINKIEFYKEISTSKSPVENIKKASLFDTNAPTKQLRTIFSKYSWARISSGVKYSNAYIDIFNNYFILWYGYVNNINFKEGYLYNGDIKNSNIDNIVVVDKEYVSEVDEDIKRVVDDYDSNIDPSIYNSIINNIEADIETPLNIDNCTIYNGNLKSKVNRRISISSCVIKGGYYVGCEFIRSDIENIDGIYNCLIKNISFSIDIDIYIGKSTIRNTIFDKGDFGDCEIKEGSFHENVKISNSNISNANLAGTKITKSTIRSCKFSDMNITNDDEININKPNMFKNCKINNMAIDFNNGNTDVLDSEFINCHLMEVDFNDGNYKGEIIFRNCTFEECYNIDSALNYIDEEIIKFYVDDEEITNSEILIAMLSKKQKDYEDYEDDKDD